MIKYFVILIQVGLVFPSIIRSDAANWLQIDKFEGIPKKSIRGGFDKDGKKTFICTSFNPSTVNMIPGSLSKDGLCKIIDNGNEVKLDKGYRILTNIDGVWIPFFDSKIPTNALETGQLDYNGEVFTYFSGRKRFDRELTLGKILYTGVGYGKGYYNDAVLEGGDEEIFTVVPKILFLNNKTSGRMSFDGFYIVFKVMASNAAVNLGADADDKPSYQITFDSRRNETSIGFKTSKEVFVVPSINIISSEEMRGFWVFLDTRSSSIKVGREGSQDPILMINNVEEFVASDIWVQFGSSFHSEWRIPPYELM